MARKRRAKGGGNPRLRADGRWEGRVTLGGKRPSVYGNTKKEAEAKMLALKIDYSRGLNLSDRPTVAEFLVEWLEGRSYQIRATTVSAYELQIRRHIVPEIGGVRLDLLSAQDVRRLVTKKLKQDLAASTVRYMYAVLHAALEQAKREKLVRENVADHVDPPPLEDREPDAFTRDEIDRLLDVARGERLEALLVTAVRTGLRQGELLALHWEDVDLDKRFLRVRRTLKPIRNTPLVSADRFSEEIVPLGGTRLYLGVPKSARSRRTVPLHDAVVQALRVHRRRQLTERMRLGSAWHDLDLVFATRTGTPTHPRNVDRAYHRLREKAGLPKLCFNTLRHTFSTFMQALGVPPWTIAALMGHGDPNVTLKHYTAVLPSSLTDAAAQLEGYLDDSERMA